MIMLRTVDSSYYILNEGRVSKSEIIPLLVPNLIKNHELKRSTIKPNFFTEITINLEI